MAHHTQGDPEKPKSKATNAQGGHPEKGRETKEEKKREEVELPSNTPTKKYTTQIIVARKAESPAKAKHHLNMMVVRAAKEKQRRR